MIKNLFKNKRMDKVENDINDLTDQIAIMQYTINRQEHIIETLLSRLRLKVVARKGQTKIVRD